jgi:hypothetical protein
MNTSSSVAPVALSAEDKATRIAALRAVKHEAVIAALIANNGQIIDDHTGEATKIPAIVKWTKGTRVEICAGYQNIFCLNDLSVDEDDGLVHLSRWSVGGTLNCRFGIVEGIADFNRESCKGMFGGWGTVELIKEF